jgi:chemotaxis regulatin CheY-phosphate phosphatase CheZ
MTKDKLKNRVLNGGRGSGQSLRLLCEVYENRINDLEQRNKDLVDCSSRLLSHAAAVTKRVVELEKENADQKDQLTKAKELLAKWVELYKPKLEGYPITPIQEQTEQFLKEAAE